LIIVPPEKLLPHPFSNVSSLNTGRRQGLIEKTHFIIKRAVTEIFNSCGLPEKYAG